MNTEIITDYPKDLLNPDGTHKDTTVFAKMGCHPYFIGDRKYFGSITSISHRLRLQSFIERNKLSEQETKFLIEMMENWSNLVLEDLD